MESLVNYCSEDEQDDYPYVKVAVRERVGSGAAISGRTATESGVPPLKRSNEHSRSNFEVESSRKRRDSGNDRFKSGHKSYNEDKYKTDRRTEKSRDLREKRDSRDSKNNRDDDRNYNHNDKYNYKKLDDQKHYREPRRDHKRDGGSDYYRDEKRYNRYDERKSTYSANNRDRFNSKSRYDDRKHYDDRFSDERRTVNEERRSGGSYVDERRREFDRRSYNIDDDRKTDRRYDDRKTQRSNNEERSNASRPRRSNSPLPLHHSKVNNKYSEGKEDKNTRRERKHHSRSRTRSRSRSDGNLLESNLQSITSLHQRTEPGQHFAEINRPQTESQNSEKKNLPTARNFEVLLTIPVSETVPKQPNAVTAPTTTIAAGPNTTTATVQLPSYYNPNVINPNKYVEQMQKRKLIWGAKKAEDSASKWGHAQFSQDQDGKVASKFMRLMGIKTANGTGGEISTSTDGSEKKSSSATPPNNKDVKSREAMFSTMEHQYEVARQVTHTMRGVGLGFSSQSRPY